MAILFTPVHLSGPSKKRSHKRWPPKQTYEFHISFPPCLVQDQILNNCSGVYYFLIWNWVAVGREIVVPNTILTSSVSQFLTTNNSFQFTAYLCKIYNKEAIWLYAELFLGHHDGSCHGLW